MLDAFFALDVPRLVSLLTDNAWIKMPPLPWEYQGRAACQRFFVTMTAGGVTPRRLELTRANGQPAYGAYALDEATGLWRARGLFVLTLAGDRTHEVTRFEVTLMEHFGLPRILPDGAAGA